MSRRRGNSIIDRALAIAYPDPEERESARRAFLRKTPHERDEIRRLLFEAFGDFDERDRDQPSRPPNHPFTPPPGNRRTPVLSCEAKPGIPPERHACGRGGLPFRKRRRHDS